MSTVSASNCWAATRASAWAFSEPGSTAEGIGLGAAGRGWLAKLVIGVSPFSCECWGERRRTPERPGAEAAGLRMIRWDRLFLAGWARSPEQPERGRPR